MFTGMAYGRKAEDPAYNRLTYAQVDCQAFCEKVLYDLGVRTAKGGRYDWRGSNDMWRNAVSWKGTVEEARQKFGEVPVGSWAFMVKHDGGEVPRGYHDNEGNAAHVSIVVNQTQVRDSTKGTGRDGVAYRKLSDFNMIGLPKMLDFDATSHNIIEIEESELSETVSKLESIISIMKGWLKK